MFDLMNRIKREAHVRTPFQMLNGTTIQRAKGLQLMCEELATPMGLSLIATTHGAHYLTLRDERTIAICLSMNPRNVTMLWACKTIAMEEALHDVIHGATVEVAANHRDVWRAGFLEWEYCGDDGIYGAYTQKDGFIRAPKYIVSTKGKGKHWDLWHDFLTGFRDSLIKMMFWKRAARATVQLFDRIDYHVLNGVRFLMLSGWVRNQQPAHGREICKAVTPHTTVSLAIEAKQGRDVRWRIFPTHLTAEVNVAQLTPSLNPYVTTTSEHEIGLADCLIEDIGSLMPVLLTSVGPHQLCTKTHHETKLLSSQLIDDWQKHAELYHVDVY